MALLSGTEQNYYELGDYGGYQFVSLQTIINQFLISYVGDNKVIPRVNSYEVEFHAQRAMQELSFDTFKSCKSQEVTVRPNLQMPLPRDYVNYTKISWVDGSGIKHRILPTSLTSNPKPTFTNEEGGHRIIAAATASTSGSPNLVLNGAYPEIIPGMVLRSSNEAVGMNNSYVVSMSTVGGVTTLVMSVNAANSIVGTPLPLEFVAAGGSALHATNGEENIEVGYFSTTSGQKWAQSYVASGPADNFNKIEVGMTVHHSAFPTGTKVVSIIPGGATAAGFNIVSFDTAATATTTSPYSQTFIFSNEDNQTSKSWDAYKGGNAINNNINTVDAIEDEDFSRYGLDPQFANRNGSFYIDCGSGKIHFSSDLIGKTIVLDYISDGVGTNDEMQVHKFAEEAMYKWIAHGILSTTMNIPEGLIARYKKERFAAIRTAKLRLSNIKLEEITQILRGKSKQIKH
jgi:hypothetical protein